MESEYIIHLIHTLILKHLNNENPSPVHTYKIPSLIL